MSNIQISLICHIRLAVFYGRGLASDIVCNCDLYSQVLSCLPLISTILLCFEWLWPWLRVTRSAEGKIFLAHFLAHISTDRDEMLCSVGAI